METPDGEGRHGIKLSAPVLLLAGVWWYTYLDPDSQRIFLFLVAFVKFAEYFYFLPKDLEQYQDEDWWDYPTIKTALIVMACFWILAWLSSKLPWMADRYRPIEKGQVGYREEGAQDEQETQEETTTR